MTRRMILPLIFGLSGLAVLLSLGVWQVQRMGWKQAALAEIAARIAADPVAIPANPDRGRDNRLSVVADVEILPQEAHVLTSRKFTGPGYLVIVPARLADGRQVILDMGFIPEAQKNETRPAGRYRITGNLLWPNEVDGFTPDPNIDRNIWFARDAGRLAQAFGIASDDPNIIAVRQVDGAGYGTEPVAIGADIPNDHLMYAITWFSLAFVWLGMTVYLLWRIRQKTV